jgi:hypothetical protein
MVRDVQFIGDMMHAEFLFNSQKIGAFSLFLLVREGGGVPIGPLFWKAIRAHS